MPRSSRPLPVLAVALLALSCSACASKNEGKIVGKWKMISGAGIDQQAKELEPLSAYMFMEFKADGSLIIGAESSDPNLQKVLQGSGAKTTLSCKYHLRSGATVEFTDMLKEMQTGGGPFGKSSKARTNVTIDGDNMTMKDSDGTTMKLVKIK